MYWDLIKSQSRGYSPAYRDRERCTRPTRQERVQEEGKASEIAKLEAPRRRRSSETPSGEAPLKSTSHRKHAAERDLSDSGRLGKIGVESLAPAMLSKASVALLVALLVGGCLSIGSGVGEPVSLSGEASSEYAAPESPTAVPDVKSADAEHLQFAQSGEPWSYMDYWGGTVAMNGCGLCAYTSVVDILTDADYTPTDMLSIRGDWEGMDNYADDRTGVASGQTHHDYTLEQFGIETYRIPVSLDSLATTCSRGDSVAVLCAGGDDIFLGTVGDEHSYPGHFVCVWKYDGVFHVHDSAISHGYGCDVIYTEEEMSELLSGTTSIMSYRKCI